MEYRTRQSENGKIYVSVNAPYVDIDFYYAIAHENSNIFFIYRNGKYEHKGAIGYNKIIEMLDKLNNKLVA